MQEWREIVANVIAATELIEPMQDCLNYRRSESALNPSVAVEWQRGRLAESAE